MKNKALIVFSLMLFVLVLIGVTIIQAFSDKELQPFAPMIVISGFFTFLVAAALFIYGIINNLRK